MVELIEADPSLGVEGAAAIAARSMGGKPSRHIERLRKKYRRLKRDGQLPRGGLAGWLEHREAEIRQYFDSRDSGFLEAGRLLEKKEREAEAAGIDISREDLFEYQRQLEGRKESLETPARARIGVAASWFVNQGITNADEAVARSLEAAKELEVVEKQIEILRELRMLRGIAGRPA